jgi:hypothetical protein
MGTEQPQVAINGRTANRCNGNRTTTGGHQRQNRYQVSWEHNNHRWPSTAKPLSGVMGYEQPHFKQWQHKKHTVSLLQKQTDNSV